MTFIYVKFVSIFSQGECKIVVESSTIPVSTGETMRKVLHAVGDAAKYEVRDW